MLGESKGRSFYTYILKSTNQWYTELDSQFLTSSTHQRFKNNNVRSECRAAYQCVLLHFILQSSSSSELVHIHRSAIAEMETAADGD